MRDVYPRYLCLTDVTEEASSALLYGIRSRKGFVTLTGEVGTGKTTLLNRLLDQLRKERVRTGSSSTRESTAVRCLISCWQSSRFHARTIRRACV